MQVLSKLRPYEPYYYLREEAVKSWDYTISDKLVYLQEAFKVTGNSLGKIAKDYLRGNIWIECHITLQIHRATCHVVICIEDQMAAERMGHLPKMKRGHLTVDGNSPMFVDVAKPVKPPEQMRRWVRSVVWLKRFDDSLCYCGYSRCKVRKLSPGSVVPLVKNRELGPLMIPNSQSRKLPNSLIQSGSSTVKEISSNQRNEERRVLDLQPNLIPAILEIFLSEKNYGFRFVEEVKLVPKFVKMYLRPGCLQIGFDQGRTRNTRHTSR